MIRSQIADDSELKEQKKERREYISLCLYMKSGERMLEQTNPLSGGRDRWHSFHTCNAMIWNVPGEEQREEHPDFPPPIARDASTLRSYGSAHLRKVRWNFRDRERFFEGGRETETLLIVETRYQSRNRRTALLLKPADFVALCDLPKRKSENIWCEPYVMNIYKY